MLHYIFLEYLLHTNPHKNVYISKQNNAINIISSDSESTINFTLENHVFGKTHILSFFLILKGLCPLKKNKTLIFICNCISFRKFFLTCIQQQFSVIASCYRPPDTTISVFSYTSLSPVKENSGSNRLGPPPP